MARGCKRCGENQKCGLMQQRAMQYLRRKIIAAKSGDTTNLLKTLTVREINLRAESRSVFAATRKSRCIIVSAPCCHRACFNTPTVRAALGSGVATSITVTSLTTFLSSLVAASLFSESNQSSFIDRVARQLPHTLHFVFLSVIEGSAGGNDITQRSLG